MIEIKCSVSFTLVEQLVHCPSGYVDKLRNVQILLVYPKFAIENVKG